MTFDQLDPSAHAPWTSTMLVTPRLRSCGSVAPVAVPATISATATSPVDRLLNGFQRVIVLLLRFCRRLMPRSASRLGDLPFPLLNEREQVAVDDVRMRRGEPVRETGIIEFRGSLDQLGRLARRNVDRHDLIVLAVHEQRRDVELFQ